MVFQEADQGAEVEQGKNGLKITLTLNGQTMDKH